MLMKRWDNKKDKQNREKYGIGFEEILSSTRTEYIEINPEYPDQIRVLFNVNGYPYLLVYEPKRDRFANFWPSKKHKRYL